MPKPLGQLMRERGVNQAALSRGTGITHAAISQIMHAKQHPSLPNARRIAEFLGMGVDDIIFPAEERKQAFPRAADICHGPTGSCDSDDAA